MDQLGNSEPTSSLLCQDDSLPLSLQRTRQVHRRLPKRFRDMIPEPPQPLPPADLDNLVPSTPTRIPSLQVAHFLTEAEPQGLPLSPDQDMDGSDSLAKQTLVLRPHQLYQTQLNLFGLFRRYDKETLPVYDPEDTSDGIAVSQPTAARMFVSTSDQLLDTENQFYPYPNKTSLHLGDWYWNQGTLKSKVDFKQLLDIIGDPSFRVDNIQDTKWASIDRGLGTLTTSDDPEYLSEWLDDDAGWKRTSVTISVPLSQRSANPGPVDYSVPDFYHRSLLSIIREHVSDPNDHHLFHYEPYELLWRRSNRDIRVHG